MEKQKAVSVVIPAWNSEKQLKRNLSHIRAAAAIVKAEIIIVDDASQDGSVEYLKSLGDNIRLYENETNLGFAATVNRGVSLASGEIVILLNTDVQPAADCFAQACQYFADDNVYGLGFNSGEAWMGGEWRQGLFHHFKVEPNKKNQDGVHPSLWAAGGQAAFSRSKWNLLGGMDVLFKPFYWEDTDMGYRAWKRGWQVLWAPQCKIKHFHRESVIANHFTKKFITETATRNQFLFIWKNISDWKYLVSHLVYLPYYLLKYPRPLLRALAHLPSVLTKRHADSMFWMRKDKDILMLWAK